MNAIPQRKKSFPEINLEPPHRPLFYFSLLSLFSLKTFKWVCGSVWVKQTMRGRKSLQHNRKEWSQHNTCMILICIPPGHLY